MSSDSIKRVEAMRSFYKAQDTSNNTENGKELAEIKNELKILNDESAYKSRVVTNATGSPYLSDQAFQFKDVLYNSTEETDWKEVKSFEQTYANTASYNMKKLNII